MLDAGPGRDRDALLPGRLARARRRADVHRLAQPQGVHRAPSSSGAARSRCRATPGSATSGPRSRRASASRPGGGPVEEVDIYDEFQRGRAEVHRPRRGQAAAGRRRRRQRDGRTDGRAAAGAARTRSDRGLLDAGRQLPRSRAQPAAAREPRVHHGRGRRAAAPTSGSPGTATPTAASSSTSTGAFVDGDFLTALLAESMLAKNPGATILYDVRASRAVADTVAARRRAGADEPRRTRVLQDADARGGRARSAARSPATTTSATSTARTRDDPGAADPGAALERGRAMSELLEPYRSRYFISGEINSEVADPAAKMEELAARYADAQPEPARRDLGRLRGLALQRPAVEHRAAAAAVPRVAALARGHGAPARRGAAP